MILRDLLLQLKVKYVEFASELAATDAKTFVKIVAGLHRVHLLAVRGETDGYGGPIIKLRELVTLPDTLDTYEYRFEGVAQVLHDVAAGVLCYYVGQEEADKRVDKSTKYDISPIMALLLMSLGEEHENSSAGSDNMAVDE